MWLLMGKHRNFFLTFCLSICWDSIVRATGRESHGDGFPTKLFVFGDSYVDSGNRNFSARSWKQPYGLTLPGTPTGRYSDGAVFTDYLASWMGIRSPIPYRWRKFENASMEYGMNFAFGGTGVFDTLVSAPNMTVQINLFQRQVQKKALYSNADLKSSVALVSLAGNDYTAYIARNGTTEGLSAFTKAMIKQLGLNLQRIEDLGVRKIAIMNLQPLGCLPSETFAYLYKNCSSSGNSVSLAHNQLLEKTVEKLNKESKESVFVILDMYKAFFSALKKQPQPHQHQPGTMLRPCCEAVSKGYKCGNVKGGKRMYVVCNNPNSTFFWDDVHPSHAGWRAVFSALKSSAYSFM